MKYMTDKFKVTNLESDLKHFLDNNYEPIYYDDGESARLKGIIPILDDGEITELLVVSELDTKDKILVLKIDDREYELYVTEKAYTQILSCNKLTYDDTEYCIEDKIYNTDEDKIYLVLKESE